MEYTQEYLDVDGERIGLHRYPWPEDPNAPVAVIFPAMGVPARYYRTLAANLTAAGIGVLAAELRGTGSSAPRPSRASRYGYAELADDVGRVLDLPALQGRRVFLLGHSLGGQACVLHLAQRRDSAVAGLILIAVGLPYFRAYPRYPWGVLAFTQAIAGVSAVLRIWPGWGFGGKQARGVIRDWGYTGRYGRFPRLRGLDVEPAIAEIDRPVLAVSVDDDQYTPAATLDYLCAKLISAPVERHHYTTTEAGASLDHFTWVRASNALTARIANFVGVKFTPVSSGGGS